MSIMMRLLCYLQVSALSGKAATEGDYLKSLGATEVNIFYSKLNGYNSILELNYGLELNLINMSQLDNHSYLELGQVELVCGLYQLVLIWDIIL